MSLIHLNITNVTGYHLNATLYILGHWCCVLEITVTARYLGQCEPGLELEMTAVECNLTSHLGAWVGLLTWPQESRRHARRRIDGPTGCSVWPPWIFKQNPHHTLGLIFTKRWHKPAWHKLLYSYLNLTWVVCNGHGLGSC